MLDIQGGNDIDSGSEDFLDVFIALAVLAAGNIGVGKFVHENDLRITGKNGVDVHFFKFGALVEDLAARNVLKLGHEFLDPLAPMGFDNADDDIFATAVATDGLAQHAESLANARRIAKEKLERALGLFRGRSDFQPFFRLLWHNERHQGPGAGECAKIRPC